MASSPNRTRYGVLTAAGYDALSGERLVYGAPRRAAVAALRARGLAPGDAVLDLGCGTGLNLPLLLDAVGPTGTVVALDASPAMLARAASRVTANGWTGVHLLLADATAVAPDALTAALGGRRFDAVLSTYALSLMPARRQAWAAAVAASRPGARLAVVDMARPTGAARLLEPLALAATAIGGADVDAHPWTALDAACERVERISLRGGHVRVHVGMLAPA